MSPNNSFKPNLLRYTKAMAEKACHGFGSTTQVGLTQALGGGSSYMALQTFGDERMLFYCAFCGGSTGTRDHCPSRVFLDQPFPDDLPVVPACRQCNASFSADEQYLACLMACVLAGSTDPKMVVRPSIRKTLEHSAALQARIERSRVANDGQIVFNPEQARVTSVITKLAQGHAL